MPRSEGEKFYMVETLLEMVHSGNVVMETISLQTRHFSSSFNLEDKVINFQI